jgi:hypothetical protein
LDEWFCELVRRSDELIQSSVRFLGVEKIKFVKPGWTLRAVEEIHRGFEIGTISTDGVLGLRKWAK